MQLARVVLGLALLLLLAVHLPQPSASQEASTSPDDQREQMRKDARAHVESFVVTGDEESRYDPVEAPLLSATDPARAESGWLWAFGAEGRPVAILEMFQVGRGGGWVQVLTLTSDQLIEVRLPNGVLWTPQKAQIAFRPIPDAPPPAKQPSLRERQAKLLARRFDAHEFWDPNRSRYELRLLETPLYTYRDEEGGVLDGAVFAFVHGTNAEILMLLEAHATEGDASQAEWKYGLVRIGSAEMHVHLDGDEVWQIDRAQGETSRDPYWTAPPG